VGSDVIFFVGYFVCIFTNSGSVFNVVLLSKTKHIIYINHASFGTRKIQRKIPTFQTISKENALKCWVLSTTKHIIYINHASFGTRKIQRKIPTFQTTSKEQRKQNALKCWVLSTTKHICIYKSCFVWDKKNTTKNPNFPNHIVG
jgi:hypothetical protein